MKSTYRLAALLFSALLSAAAHAAEPVRAPDAFERITPEQAGYSRERLAALADLLARSGSQSMLLLKDGKVFFEWGDIHRKLLVHSIRKPLLNALIGRALGDGCLDLEKSVGDYGIDERTPLTAQEKSATLRQLLQSRSGVYLPAAAEAESMIASRPARGSHAPGSFYYYNNWDFNVAGAIYQRCVGREIYDAFNEQIARPLGMRDYTNRIYAWPDESKPIPAEADGLRRLEPERSRYGAAHFRLSAHDLALFGQLYLQRGNWKGQQLIPAAWIDESTQPISLIDPDWGHAYGQLWDVLVPEPGQRPAFFHTGAGVHMLGVYPELGLVMVHRVDTESGTSKFNDGDLYAVIRAMHAARLKPGETPSPAH